MIRVAKETVLAARKRGWSLHKIAHAAGISHQAVQQIIKRHDSSLSGTIANRHSPGRRVLKGKKESQWLVCEYCGKGGWVSASRYLTKFCSHKCSLAAEKVIYNTDVTNCIKLRLSGESWSHISRLYGVSMQSIQRAIWIHLSKHKQLSRDRVFAIWRPQHHLAVRSPGWSWLEKRTGSFVDKPETWQGVKSH